MTNDVLADDRTEAEPVTSNGTSPDLPYELQARLFEQLATMGVAGAGLVITLRGSVLSEASGLIWMGAVEFGLAALVALAAQIGLIEALLTLRVSPRKSHVMTLVSVLLIGMGIGTLGMSVFLESAPSKSLQADIGK